MSDDANTVVIEALVARRIVAAIIRDFTDRRGLRQEWEQIDDETQAEIRDEWQRRTEKCLASLR